MAASRARTREEKNPVGGIDTFVHALLTAAEVGMRRASSVCHNERIPPCTSLPDLGEICIERTLLICACGSVLSSRPVLARQCSRCGRLTLHSHSCGTAVAATGVRTSRLWGTKGLLLDPSGAGVWVLAGSADGREEIRRSPFI